MTSQPVTGTLHARLCATSTDHGRVHHLEVRVAHDTWIRLGGILRDESARLIETALHASQPPAGEPTAAALRAALEGFLEPMRRYRTHTTWLKGDEDMLIAAHDRARAILDPDGAIPREEADLAFPPRTPPTPTELDRMERALLGDRETLIQHLLACTPCRGDILDAVRDCPRGRAAQVARRLER